MIVVVINTAPGEGDLFYASLPDTAPQLQPVAEKALADLRVS